MPINQTAFAEALAQIQAADEAAVEAGGDVYDNFSLMPSYMVATDTNNIANKNQTFLESAADSISNIPKFIGTSLVSGANQLYNIPADVGNMLGGDFERSDTGEIIADFDSDLGAY